MRRRALLAAIAPLAIPALAQPAAPSPWPDRPVKLVIPFAPGGSNDVIARALAERLQAVFGQPFVAENRAGAGGQIGAQYVAAQPADGQTLLIASLSVVSTAVAQPGAPDPAKAFDAVARLASASLAVAGTPDLPARSIAELVALAHTRPLRFGSAGPGTINHFSDVLFGQVAGIEMEHVPYRGLGPATLDLVAGRIDLIIGSPPALGGPLKTGQLRLLATTGAQRAPHFPQTPTVKEAGLDFEVEFWWGILAPHGTPPAVRAALEGAIRSALSDAAFERFFENEGARAAFLPGAEYQGVLAAESARWRQVAARAGLKVD
jgi:tripartite-type tricarboxylate transporter receptor subunit TctC